MRGRLIFVVVALLLVAGFAARNWPEFQRAAPLNVGWRTVNAPLGLIMLALLGLVLFAFLISSALQQSRNMIESNRHSKALQAQRDLAEKAETSRFTELRQQLDTHLRENRQREAIAASEFEKAMVQSQRELRNQLELMNRTLGTRLGELESRLEARLDRLHPAAEDLTTPRERAKA
jgi:DNA anti-recombination protein RmuC